MLRVRNREMEAPALRKPSGGYRVAMVGVYVCVGGGKPVRATGVWAQRRQVVGEGWK